MDAFSQKITQYRAYKLISEDLIKELEDAHNKSVNLSNAKGQFTGWAAAKHHNADHYDLVDSMGLNHDELTDIQSDIEMDITVDEFVDIEEYLNANN